MTTEAPPRQTPPAGRQLDRVTIRFAGDSGDGMQLTGTQFTRTAAAFGNDISTFPDFPAEIRAPAGSLPGVSGFQLSFSSTDIHTPGDAPDVLVAMNPAALKANVSELPAGGALIVNEDAFTPQNLAKVGYASNPLTDGSLKQWNVFSVPISTLNSRALEGLGLTNKQVDLTKNFFALGLMFWLYERDMAATIAWIDDKFAKRQEIAEANKRALKAGYNFGETTEIFHERYVVPPAKLDRGNYRNITGNEATALGFVAASKLSGRDLFYGSYPITPASDILHQLAGYKNFGVKTFQAEDEIAAIGASIGASYGGALGLTASSGPGIALKSEALGLAVMVELPLVVVDVQRSGPSTGMPTKAEQADLLQVLYGRNSDSPVAVVAPATPGECFEYAIEAWRLALKYMTPVVYMSDAFLATGAEPWRIPDLDDLPSIAVPNRTERDGFYPYLRDPETLARPWAVPGTPGLEHRIGGLEKADILGNVSYDPENHHRMQLLRQAKIDAIANDIPPLDVFGPAEGDLLILGWGSTYGAIRSAVERLQSKGRSVAHAHVRYLNPLPANTGDVVRAYRRVLIPEVNLGQLSMLIRARYLVDAVGYNRVRGKPFRIAELEAEAERVLAGGGNEPQRVEVRTPAPRPVAAAAANPAGDGG
ncbi:MAG TPA: 2-oxoacid:acceptor oxidoreductase subunit alpha [Candidatus Limnocylindrales bacterium]|nr:2-oxoacid:acceptor oxidoreductase subunit alpha [Candidatus Limnocylindrales bacterium]